MKPVLIIKNSRDDSAGYLQFFLDRRNVYYTILTVGENELPTTIKSYAALAILGGSMSANDFTPANVQIQKLILQAMYFDIPVIGHCLGGQLMAKALGAKIAASPKPEIGWQPIKWTNDPLTTQWFGDSPVEKVMQWHFEAFELPEGATLLASSEACPNQAFAIGKHLAMQFHIEVTWHKIANWITEESYQWSDAKRLYDTVQDRNEIDVQIPTYIRYHEKTADQVYKTWLQTTEWAPNLNLT